MSYHNANPGSTVENGNPLNRFSVTEGLLPALNVSREDMLMEWPAEKAGWDIPQDQLETETGFVRSVISFAADVYLGEDDLEDVPSYSVAYSFQSLPQPYAFGPYSRNLVCSCSTSRSGS